MNIEIVGEMNITVLGAGEVGINLARVLSQEGHNVVVIDEDRSALARVEEVGDVQVVEGNAVNLTVLQKSEIKACDLLLAVTNNDEVNMLSCLLAKNLTDLTTVARLKKEFFFQGTKTFYRNKLGIDLIVCPEILTGVEIIYELEESGTNVVEALADGHVEVKRIHVDEKFKFLGEKIINVSFPPSILIGAIKREGEFIIPGGNDMIQKGDEIYVVGETMAIENIESTLGLKKEWWFFSHHESAVIVGGGRIGRLVAQMLAMREIRVRIIDEDPEKCQRIAEEMTGVLVLCADGTNYQVYQEEHLNAADHFIAASDDDASNILASLMARDMGIKNIITVISSPGYRSVLSRLNLHHVVSPRFNTAQVILEYIKNRNMLLHPLQKSSPALALEIYIDDHFPLKGEKLKNIKFPENSLVACVLRGEKVFVPKGEDALHAGDIVIFFTLKENVDDLRKIFDGEVE